MPYFYLIGAVSASATTNLFNAFFARKNQNVANSSGFYSLFYAAFAFLSWLILFLIEPSFDWGTVWYAVGFAIFYVMGVSGYALAYKSGPIMLTSLFVSLSLIGVTVWGFFFWGDDFTYLVAIGLALVITAVTLCLYKGKTHPLIKEYAQKTQEQSKSKDNAPKISIKWILFVLLSFVGNAGCTIVQRTQQTAQQGQHGNLLMLLATGLATIVFAMIYFIKDASAFKRILGKTGHIPMFAGVSNFLLNVFVILMASTALSPSLIYPVMSIGSLSIVTIASIFFFKERMKWWQWLGVVFGAAAVVILSL